MIVIIDNHDSFTYNLVHYFAQFDAQTAVFQNSQITAAEVKKLSPDLIVLSPGPGRPAKFGASHEILNSLSNDIPILGVCLGHQAIVEHFGGSVIKGEQPMHGKVSLMTHDKEGVFKEIPSPTKVTRYHSLVADQALIPDCLIANAWTADGAVMGVRHRTLPIAGIQFHPESVMTDEGFLMLKNCYVQAKAWKIQKLGGSADGKSISSI